MAGNKSTNTLLNYVDCGPICGPGKGNKQQLCQQAKGNN